MDVESCSKLTASDRSVPGARFLICSPYIFNASDDTIYKVLESAPFSDVTKL